ncbi:MAG: hypothetical protein GY877_09340 [Hyphomicrobium sp.]|nr:hypothetical protein [Hyphomicrobium sp.]
MLGALLKREIEVELLDTTAARRPTLKAVVSPKRRAKSFPVVLLYPESEPEPQSQAEAVLSEIQKHAEHAIGNYVPSTHLQRFYGELCEREGWKRKHWCVMGHELGKLTNRVCKKRGTN